jgi:TrmH family RNA methyltransferase
MLGKSKIKYIQSLGQKKVRDEEGLFIAEGPKLIAEFLTAGNVNIKQVYALKEWIDEHENAVKGIDVSEISEAELGKISQLATPNQVVAVVQKFAVPVTGAKNRITLVLDTLQDPGNLGTIIRITDWFGISHIVCSPGSADLYNPKVVQSTMGSLTRVNVLYTDLLTWLEKQQGVPVYAASLDGQDVSSMKKITEGILLIGNESKGISDELLNRADKKITITGKGRAESLNAAVAAGIILSHIV